jgi:pantoate--beta-alanine ligase
MGNLHAGHLSLVEQARKVADKVVTSIFVNPTQFVEGEDFEEYPRTLDADLSRLAELETDLVFNPDLREIYPTGLEQQTKVLVPSLDNKFCGKFRPGHFTGVATVVTKLFNIVQPDIAVFGEKDYQQLLVIKCLVDDLCIPVKVIGAPTIREEDGLALSSRNVYLTEEEREIAPVLYKTLSAIAGSILEDKNGYAALEEKALSHLSQAGFKPEYLIICNADDLCEPGDGDLVVLAAAWLGRARLIDNVIIRR